MIIVIIIGLAALKDRAYLWSCSACIYAAAAS